MNKILNFKVKYKNIELFLVILLSAIILVPHISIFGITKLVIPIFILWIIIIMLKKNNLFLNRIFWGLLILLIYFSISSVISDGNFFTARIETVVYIFIIFLITYYYNLPSNRDKTESIILWSIIFILIQAIYNILGAYNHPELLKALAGSKSNIDAIWNLKLGIAGYGTIYSYAIIGPSFVYISLKNKSNAFKLRKIMLFTTGIISIICVYSYTYTTAIVLCTIILILFLLLINKKIGLILLAATLISISIIDNIFLYIINSVENISVSERLATIYNVVFGSGDLSDESSLTRLRLYDLSLNTFLSNPILGVGGFYGHSSVILPKGIGGHSEWLDFLARYGIFGLSLLLIPLFSLINLIQNTLKHVDNKFYIYIILYIFILGFINTTASNSLIFTIIFIIPFCAYNFLNQEEAKR